MSDLLLTALPWPPCEHFLLGNGEHLLNALELQNEHFGILSLYPSVCKIR